jgi:hypothetical protein
MKSDDRDSLPVHGAYVELTDRGQVALKGALGVGRLADELQVIAAQIPDFLVMGQTVMVVDDKTIDVITVRDANGDDLEFHFEISRSSGRPESCRTVIPIRRRN